MTDISVRDERNGDRDACAAIYARAWPMAFPGFQCGIDRAVFDKDTENELVFVALCAGNIIGFGAYYPPGNFLHHLYVDPCTQGQGAGSALLKAIQAQAQPGLSLKVQSSNHLARAFYAARGFSEGATGQDQFGPWILCTFSPP